MEEQRRERDRVERAAKADGMKAGSGSHRSPFGGLTVAAADLIGSNGTKAGDRRARPPPEKSDPSRRPLLAHDGIGDCPFGVSRSRIN